MENLERAILMIEAAGDAIRGNNQETAMAYLEADNDFVKDELIKYGNAKKEGEKCLLTI